VKCIAMATEGLQAQTSDLSKVLLW
jgi:hypothetical protein